MCIRDRINLLQGASATGRPIDATTVYSISGRANPQVIEKMVNEAVSGNLSSATTTLQNLLLRDGIAPLDLVRQIHRVVRNTPSLAIMEVIRFLAETEFRIAEGSDGEIQLTALLSSLSELPEGSYNGASTVD